MKKLISALILTVILLTLTACNNEITVPENLADYKPVPTPENGWTSETVALVFYINGEPISYPFTAGSLGEDYSLVELTTKSWESSKGVIYYKKTALLSLDYRDKYSLDELPSVPVRAITIGSDPTSGKVDKKAASMIFFNGITLGATKDEIRAKFGDPDYELGELSWHYNRNREGLVEGAGMISYINFQFNSKGELFRFRLSFYTEEELQSQPEPDVPVESDTPAKSETPSEPEPPESNQEPIPPRG